LEDEAMIASDTTVGIRWLGPEEVSASWEPEASRLCLKLAEGGEFPDAQVVQAFPVSAPGEMIELSDRKGETVGVLWSLQGLDAESRDALRAALEARYLVPQITRLFELVETAPFVLRWRVLTDRGERSFHTESSREAIRFQTPDDLRITDLAGDQYDLRAMRDLDPVSRSLLSTVI
jgi:hypothetical protein